ncbi:LlaJI family restriction endonuclease [Bifidobacterium sp. ESL0704]|uniref:LlaJI family restriction endonuclease n=1 Tax=Bifidobacterium sp. ESL0704 TaxID=2983219 RepID=UPI0023F6BB28|nr:LlaJI family restriction endonuclease [Bifidobacterium sp. ESL0704]WEV53477.1 LlaJI family restriction endonuclease [Bifidobacterium sp. ESL0704]
MKIPVFIEKQECSLNALQLAWGLMNASSGHAQVNEEFRRRSETEEAIKVLKNINVADSGRTNLLVEEKDKKKYKFNYVGFISVWNSLFIVLPKYYFKKINGDGIAKLDSHVVSQLLGDLIESVHIKNKRLGKTPQEEKLVFRDTFELRNEYKLEQNKLSLYRVLLNDYAENGMYTSSCRIYEHNGCGNVEWNRTVESCSPVAVENMIGYWDFITTRRIPTKSRIAEIQQAIVDEISVTVEQMGLNKIFKLPLCGLRAKQLSELGTPARLFHEVHNELYAECETRKKRLLQAMCEFLNDYSPSQKRKVMVDGTARFDRVWEQVCQDLFENRDEELQTDRPHWEFYDDAEVEKHFLNAKDDSDEKKSEDTAALERDIVSYHSTRKNWYVLDAKYYIPQYGRGKRQKISGQPDTYDIIKQYFYAIELERKKGKDSVYGNAFILPARNNFGHESKRPFLVQRGQVSLAFLPVVESDITDNTVNERVVDAEWKKCIRVFEMDPEQALGAYVGEYDHDSAEIYLGQMFPESNDNIVRYANDIALKAD